MKKKPLIQPAFLLPMILLAWMGALVLAFSVFQLGLMDGAPGLMAAGGQLKNILAVLLTISAMAVVGYAFVPPSVDENLRGLLAPLLGMILLGVVVLTLGWIGWFPPTALAWASLASLHVLFYKNIMPWVKWLKAQWLFLWKPLNQGWLRVGRLLVMLLLVMALGMAMAPATQWDALMYHLSAGQFYLQNGAIVSSLDNYRFSNPGLAMMWFLWLQILAGSESGAILMWAVGLLLLAGIRQFARLAREGESTDFFWLCVMLVFSINGVWLALTRAYSDIAVVVFFVAAVVLLFYWQGQTKIGPLILAGVCAGAAVAIKYTAFPVPIGLALLTIVLAKRSGKAIVPSLIALSLPAFVVLAPWLLKNLWLDGNPISPYVWGSPAWNEFDQSYTPKTPFGAWYLNGFLLPLQAAVFGTERRDPFQGSIGVVVIALLPLISLEWKRQGAQFRHLVTALLLTGLPAYLVWTIGASISQNLAIVRFYYPMFVLLAVVIGFWLFTAPDQIRGFPIGKLAKAIVAIGFMASLGMALAEFARLDPLAVVLGQESSENYLARQLGGYYQITREVHQLAQQNPDVRVVNLWEPRTYYCAPYCSGDDNLNTWQKDLYQQRSPGAAVDYWQANGFTHVLVYESGAEFLLQSEFDRIPPLRASEYALLQEVIDQRMIKAAESAGYSLYQLLP